MARSWAREFGSQLSLGFGLGGSVVMGLKTGSLNHGFGVGKRAWGPRS